MKVIIFDIGGVLCSDTYNEIIDSHYKGTEELNDIQKAGQKAWDLYKVGKLNEDQFWNQIKDNSKMNLELNYLKETVRENLISYPHTIEVVEEIQGKFELGILSNHADEWIEYIFDKYPTIPKNFSKDLIFISSAIGLSKPDIKCYEYVHQKIQEKFPKIEKHQVLFIDDKIKNVETAKTFGWESFVYDARKETGDDLRKKLNLK